jgi:hypothetical protein
MACLTARLSGVIYGRCVSTALACLPGRGPKHGRTGAEWRLSGSAIALWLVFDGGPGGIRGAARRGGMVWRVRACFGRHADDGQGPRVNQRSA